MKYILALLILLTPAAALAQYEPTIGVPLPVASGTIPVNPCPFGCPAPVIVQPNR